MKEDGAFVDLGGALNYDTPTASLSGVWTLNKSEHPLKIYLIGEHGGVTVRVTEKNVEKPLATETEPYWNTFETTSDAEYTPYYGSDEGDELSIDVMPDYGTTVQRVYFGSYLMDDPEQQISAWKWDNAAENNPVFEKNRNHGLSVYFTAEGVLTYYPNKDSVNN